MEIMSVNCFPTICLKELVTSENYSFYDIKDDCQFRLQLTDATYQCMRRNELNQVVVGDCSMSPNTMFSYENKKLRNGHLCIDLGAIIDVTYGTVSLKVGDCNNAPVFELLHFSDGQGVIQHITTGDCIHVHQALYGLVNQPLVKYEDCTLRPQNSFKMIW